MSAASEQAVMGRTLQAAGGIADERYGPTAVLLHWLIAMLVLITLPLGLYMVELSLSPAKLKYYSWHKWIGVTVFLLAVVRAIWRFGHRPPAPVPSQPRWQVIAAHGVHAALYLLLIAAPLSGWLYSSAAGFPTVYLGVVQLPDLVPKDEQLKQAFKLAHVVLTYTMGALVLLHIVAALKHAIADRDGTLSRMWLRSR